MSEKYGSLWDMMDKRLEYIEESINTIKTDVAVIKDRQITVIEDIVNVKNTVYGNGKIGVCERMAITEKTVKILCGGAVIIAVAIVGLAVKASGQNPPIQVKSLWEQPGGLNTSRPGHLIPDNDFTDLGDVFTDKGPYIEKRGGLSTIYSIGKSYPVNQIYENIKLDGKRYGIVKSSGELGYINTANSYVVLLTTLSETSRLWMTQYNNECYLGTSNKDEDVWKFDPSVTNVLNISTYVPKSKYPVIFYDKMFAIGITTPLANTAPITTSGDESVIRYSGIGDLKRWDGDFWIGVNRNDGEIITGAAVYRGNLYVFKTNSTHQIMRVENEDNTDGERAIKILANIGCISHDTIKEVNGLLYWVSSQGVIEFDGTSYKIVSEDIREELDEVLSSDAQGTASIIDTTAADFGAGTIVSVDTTSVSGSVTLQRQNLINQANSVATEYMQLKNSTEYYQTFMTSYTLNLSTIAPYMFKESVTAAPLQVMLKTNANVLIASQAINSGLIGATTSYFPVDFTSWNVSLTSGTTYKLVMLSTSAIGYRWGGAEGITKDNYPRGASNEVWDYDEGEIIIHNSAGDFAFRIYQLHYGPSLAGSFTSQKRQTNAWQQWGTIAANFSPTDSGNTGTNIQWYVSAATASEICSTSNLSRVTTGQIIALSSGTYVLWYASMTTNNIGVSPQIDDVIIQYYGNITISPSLVSYPDNFDLRYWLAGRSVLSDINDVLYVYQIKNQKWVKHNLGVRCMTDYKGDFVMGGSALTGKVYKYSDSYTTDAGTTISPYVKSKDFILGSRMQDVKINEIWLYAEPSVTYTTMTVTYFPNLKDTQWNISSDIGLGAVTGYADMFVKKKVYVSTLDRIRTLGVRFSLFDKLYGMDMMYTIYPAGER